MEACWDPVASKRPSFDAIVSRLHHLKEAAPHNSASRLTFTPPTRSLRISGIMPSQITINTNDFSKEECLVSYQAEGLQRMRIHNQESISPSGGAFVLTNIDSVASGANFAQIRDPFVLRPALPTTPEEPPSISISDGIVLTNIDESVDANYLQYMNRRKQ